MIKITDWARQNGNVVLSITFDDYAGVERNANRSFPIQTVLNMSLDEIRTALIQRVETVRASFAQTDLDNKFNPIKNVDIEAGLP